MTMRRFLQLAVYSATLASLTSAEPTFLEQLYDSRCTNCDKIARKIGFETSTLNPYEDASWSGYGVEFKTDVNCVVVVDKHRSKREGKLVYSLKEERSDRSRSLRKDQYVTHSNACGACSDLRSLASYIESTQLEQQVGSCGIQGLIALLRSRGVAIPSASFPDVLAAVLTEIIKLQGLVRGGTEVTIPQAVFETVQACIDLQTTLEGRCIDIWAWSTLYDALNCGYDCIFATAIANIPANEPNPPYSYTPPYAFGKGPNYCDAAICPNTINGEPACYPEASLVGNPFRLNFCLQCDECHSGPIFLELAGRNRRNSGLISNIGRPESVIADITHDYGLL